MQDKNRTEVGRRDFLRVLGVGAAAASAAPLASAVAAESATEKTKARYRESEDVKMFYRVNRYPPAKK